MGLFEKKEICTVCNNEMGKKKLNDGWICKSCIGKCGVFGAQARSSSDIEKAIKRNEINKANKNKFKATNKIGNYIHVDEPNKLISFPATHGKGENAPIYAYDEIIGCDVLEDGESISKGGLGRAVAGGLLFGGVGAIVGGVTGSKKTKQIIRSMKVKITVRDISNPTVFIPLIFTETKSNSFIYSAAKTNAEQIVSLINVILDQQQNTQQPISESSNADEIRKYKALADEGIITMEEFENKKKKLLNL